MTEREKQIIANLNQVYEECKDADNAVLQAVIEALGEMCKEQQKIIESLGKQQSRDAWRAVKDELPPAYEEVVLLYDGDWYVIGWLKSDGTWDSFGSLPKSEPINWMSLAGAEE